MTPTATYRVQFHAGFTFADAAALAPYWAALGISHLYASPIATARLGSTHGYDVTDPTTINPALGGEEGFRALVHALRAQGLGLVLDIVPNHVAVGGGDNDWWLDVLENGQASRYAGHFDIDWAPADRDLAGKVLAPFLGAPYAQALAAGDIALDVEADLGRLSVLAHGAHRFPLRREDYASVLAAVGADTVADIDPGGLAGIFDRASLHELLERQHYRLAWWRTAGDAINWRRFFDIIELAGLRIEDPAVFDAVHALPLRLYREGLIDGLRVDHVDGLALPGAYGRRLREALVEAAPDRTPWVVVEKILGSGEALADDWGVDGTTGYEVMNEISAVQHAAEGAQPLAALWNAVSGRPADFAIEEHAARREVLTRDFAAQLNAAARAFHRLAQADIATRDLPMPGLRRALVALITAFSTYRTYANETNKAPQDPFDRAATAEPASTFALAQIRRWLAADGDFPADLRTLAIRRFEQLSAPVAAKAVEDTAFYRYGRLLSRNDVGFDPGRLSTSPARFLALADARGRAFPNSLLTTATHDHKRGEDVRARLAVLSHMPEAWAARARAWLDLAPPGRMDPGDAHMLHQTILGAWPMDLSPTDGAGLTAFAERLAGWQRKALREAKLRSAWSVPDEAYEAICEDYLRGLLEGPDEAFRDDCAALVATIAPAGVANSFVQAGLRLTLPGVPDLFQGAEFWDFSLVDPDNRRPVDYAARIKALQSEPEAFDWREGGAKQALIKQLLHLRRQHPDLFCAPLQALAVRGRRAEQVVAFERGAGSKRLVVIAGVGCAPACLASGAPSITPDWWDDTALPDGRSIADLTRGAPFWAAVV